MRLIESRTKSLYYDKQIKWYDREYYTQRDRQTDRVRNRQTDREADRERDYTPCKSPPYNIAHTTRQQWKQS